MKTHFAAQRVADRKSNLLPGTAKTAVAIALLGCLIAGAFTVATSTADAAKGERAGAQRADVQSVNRISKGDRLPTSSKSTFATTPLVTTLRRPPVGCDPAFSRAADPARAHIFGRCVS